MPKLQMIKRANGSLVYSINIPLEVIEELGWQKGMILSLETRKERNSSIVIIFKREEQINEQEEEINATSI